MLETQKCYHSKDAKSCVSTMSENDKKLYQQKIDLIDKQIDNLVYELYNLTNDEIKIIENSA